MPEPIIKIQKLDVIYFMGKSNEVQALKDINLEIYPGEFIIFFGPSGCGKSTLLYAISGLETNIQGTILINNKDISKMELKELEDFHRRTLGMIFQAYYLISSLTVLRNVTLPQIFLEVNKGDRKKKANDLLEHFGVTAQALKLPHELSGGQQQRVAICRSLINSPDVLLADEPVGNLDSTSSDEVMKLLGELNDNEKKTIILVTHNPEHLRYAHRIFFMKDGRIIETKVNKIVDRSIQPLVEKEKMEAKKPDISRELELLLRTYASLSSAQAGSLLIPFKAKQITLEAIASLTTDDIDKIQKRVENLLSRGVDDNNAIMEFLDVDMEKGGMGMNKKTAQVLTEKIKDIVKEIKFLEAEESKAKLSHVLDTDLEIVEIRRYLLDEYNANIADLASLKVLDNAVKARLENTVDRYQFQKILDTPAKKGGVGLDKRTVKKMARRFELLILGKYK